MLSQVEVGATPRHRFVSTSFHIIVSSWEKDLPTMEEEKKNNSLFNGSTDVWQ